MARSTHSRKAKSGQKSEPLLEASALANIQDGPISPIHRLPLESLAHIFSYIVPCFSRPGQYIPIHHGSPLDKWSEFTQVMLVCRYLITSVDVHRHNQHEA